MEQYEEKKIKTSRRKRTRRQSLSMSKPNSSFPLDLLSEILLKLPAKSIARFHCVSKLWSSITTDSYFINSFKTRPSRKPSLLIYFKTMENSVVFSFPQHHQNSNEPHRSFTSQPLDCFQIKYRRLLYFPCTPSVHGLICFRRLEWIYETPVIWNPTMRQFLTLTKPKNSWRNRITVFLGYDTIERKHKVVCMPRDEFCDKCWVLTLGSSYWRRIKTNIYHRPFAGICGNEQCIDGVLYYKSYLDHIGNQVLMSFDVRSEKFKPITLPLGTQRDLMIVYEGRLGFVNRERAEHGKGIKLIALKDAEKEEWSIRASSKPYPQLLERKFKLSGVTDGGEFIFVSSEFHNSLCILYFDPKRDSFRKVVFEGIFNGLGNGFVDMLQAFPNHIESVISL